VREGLSRVNQKEILVSSDDGIGTAEFLLHRFDVSMWNGSWVATQSPDSESRSSGLSLVGEYDGGRREVGGLK
jgi:hypothetical protein